MPDGYVPSLRNNFQYGDGYAPNSFRYRSLTQRARSLVLLTRSPQTQRLGNHARSFAEPRSNYSVASPINRMKNFILATSTLIGTIIGVGMFGLPYAAAQAGWGLTLVYLLVLGAVVTLMHLIYGEIVLRTQAKHRLVGYAEVYLGRSGKFIGSIIFFVTLYLALLVYLIIGGEFLSLILSGVWNISPTNGAMMVALLGFGVVFRGLKLTGALEFVMAAGLIVLILGLAGYAFEFTQTESLSLLSPARDVFLPYGVILFALAGGSAIPEIRNFFTGGRGGVLKTVIITGTLVPVLVYALFITAVLSLSGQNTSPETLAGLTPILGPTGVKFGALMGFLAVITSFFTIGLNIQNSFRLDFGLSKLLSRVLTAGVPVALFFYGYKNFINILSFTGAVLGGLEGLLLLWIWRRSRKKGTRNPEYQLKLNTGLIVLLALVFGVGIIYSFLY